MAQWQYNETPITYNEPGLQYNNRGTYAAILAYYTGGIALAKSLLRRGLGF